MILWGQRKLPNKDENLTKPELLGEQTVQGSRPAVTAAATSKKKKRKREKQEARWKITPPTARAPLPETDGASGLAPAEPTEEIELRQSR